MAALPLSSRAEATYSCLGPSQFGSPANATLPRRRKTDMTQQSHPQMLGSQTTPRMRMHLRTFTSVGLNSQLSDVDEIVFGSDIDQSGNTVKDVRVSPHFAKAFGQTSRQHEAALMRERPDIVRNVHQPRNHHYPDSDMRAVIYSQAPAAAPPVRQPAATAPSLSPFDGAAGYLSTERQRRARGGVGSLLQDAGLHPNVSDVDEVVFGRDLDASNTVVKDVRLSERFQGAAGGTSRHIAYKPVGKRRLRPDTLWGAAPRRAPEPEDEGVVVGAQGGAGTRRAAAPSAPLYVPMSRQVGDFASPRPQFVPPSLPHPLQPQHAAAAAAQLDASSLAARQWQANQLRASRHMLPPWM